MPMTRQELENYVRDHLPYERQMLDYTLHKISQRLSQADWNAYYVSFAVHARNLYGFLTNADKGNARACDFVLGFRADKSSSTIQTFPKLLEQVFHVSPKRPSESHKKVQLKDAEAFYSWIKKNFDEFLKQLPSDLAAMWGQQPSTLHSRGMTGPVASAGASSASFVVNSGTPTSSTSSGGIIIVTETPANKAEN